MCKTESESCSVLSDSLRPHGLHSLWNSPGQTTGMSSYSLLLWIFLTQELNRGLLHCRQIVYQLSYHNYSHVCTKEGLHWWLSDKESSCNAEDAGDVGSIPGERSPGEGLGNPLQYSCLENPHGQRSLAGCSPWGCKESDTTERLTLSLSR